MASGSFKTNVVTSAGTGYHRQIEVIWTSTNNTSTNKSTVNWSAYSRATDSNNTARWVNAWHITVTINGTATDINGSTTKALYKDTLIGSGSVVVNHNSDGRKTGVAVAISARIWDSSVTNATCSSTINLDPNPVYTLTVSAGANSSIVVNRTSCAGAGSTGTITAGEKKLYYGDVLKITASANTNFRLESLKVNNTSFTSGNTHTVAGAVTVTSTAQALASVISVGSTSVAIAQGISINVTKYNSGYAHSIAWSFAGHSGYITSSGGTQSSESKFTDTSFTLTIPSAWGDYIPSATSGVCTLTCKTYSGTSSTTQLGSSTTCSFTVSATSSSSGPQITTSTVEDINPTTVALTGSSARLIKYMSTARCTLSASARHGATLKTATINGSSVMSTSSASVTGATKTYQNVTSSSFTFAVSDSRGYSASVPKSPTLVQYVKLTCTPTVQRRTTSSTDVILKVSGAFYNGAFNAANSNTNTLTIKYRYKEDDGSSVYPNTWTTISSSQITKTGTTYSTGNITINGPFDTESSYVFQVVAQDGVGNTVLTSIEKEIVVRRGLPVFDWGAGSFNFNVPIIFENQQQTKAAQIAFRNNADIPESEISFPHNLSIVGGNPTTAFGWYLYDRINTVAPIAYRDSTTDIKVYHRDGESPSGLSFLADFPNEVKYDTSTGLYYRTWFSGVAEVWGKVTFSSVSDEATTGTGSLHYSSLLSKTLPVTFAEAFPLLTGSTNLTWATNVSVSGNTLNMRMMRATTLSGSYGFHIHIIGKLDRYVDRVYTSGVLPAMPSAAKGGATLTSGDESKGDGTKRGAQSDSYDNKNGEYLNVPEVETDDVTKT